MKLTDLNSYTVTTPRSAPSPSEETQQPSGGLLQSAGNVLGGATYSFSAPGRTIQKGVSSVINTLTGGRVTPEVATKEGFEASTGTDIDTASGKIGQFGGEVLSYALPGGAAYKGTRGASLLTRAAALGGTDAFTTAIREGELNRDVVDSAIIGAVFPVVGRAGQVVRTRIPTGKDSAAKVINSLIKPLKKDFAYGKNPGLAVAEEGITANSLDDLTVKIRAARQAVGEDISTRVSQSPARFQATDSLAPLDEAIEEAMKNPRTNATVIKRLTDIKADILRVSEDGVPTRNLEDLSASELWELNKEVGDLARWTGNASDDEIVNKAVQRAYGNTRRQLESGVDGLGEASEKYANLKSAEIATEYREAIAARQNLISFSGAQLGTVAALGSALAGGGPIVPILAGAGVAGLTEGLKTPAIKTRVAAWLASASKQEVDSAFKQLPWLRSTLQSALFGDEESD